MNNKDSTWHPVRVFISQYVTLKQAEWDLIHPCLSRRFIPRQTILQQQGKPCVKLWFLETGLCRFFVNRDGQEVTKFFTRPPYFFTSQRSLNTEEPSMESIDTLEDSMIWEMSKEDAFTLLELKPWSEFVRKLVQEVQFFTEQLYEDLQNLTAEERYLAMLEENDSLVNRVPLKDLASFLGIAPQSLSRIRKKFADS